MKSFFLKNELRIDNHDFTGSKNNYKMSTSLDRNQVKLKKDDIEFTIAVYDNNAGKRAAGLVDVLNIGFVAIGMLLGVLGFGLACKYLIFYDKLIPFFVQETSNMNLLKW